MKGQSSVRQMACARDTIEDKGKQAGDPGETIGRHVSGMAARLWKDRRSVCGISETR